MAQKRRDMKFVEPESAWTSPFGYVEQLLRIEEIVHLLVVFTEHTKTHSEENNT